MMLVKLYVFFTSLRSMNFRAKEIVSQVWSPKDIIHDYYSFPATCCCCWWWALGPKCCPRAHNFILIGGRHFSERVLAAYWCGNNRLSGGCFCCCCWWIYDQKMVFFGNFWLFLMMVVWSSNPKMAAKHQLSCFPNSWLFESWIDHQKENWKRLV